MGSERALPRDTSLLTRSSAIVSSGLGPRLGPYNLEFLSLHSTSHSRPTGFRVRTKALMSAPRGALEKYYPPSTRIIVCLRSWVVHVKEKRRTRTTDFGVLVIDKEGFVSADVFEESFSKLAARGV